MVRESLEETSLIVSKVENSITGKVWKQDITTAVDNYNNTVAEEIRESLAQTTQNLDGFITTVSNTYSTKADTNDLVSNQVKSINESISTANSNITTLRSDYETFNTELGNLKTRVESSIEQTDQDITMKFDQLQAQTTHLTSSVNDRFSNLSTYIRFDSNGIELGKSEQPFKLNITNTAITFSNNGTQLAKMEGQLLTIDRTRLIDAEIGTSLRIGRFVFEPRANGNLSLLKK